MDGIEVTMTDALNKANNDSYNEWSEWEDVPRITPCNGLDGVEYYSRFVDQLNKKIMPEKLKFAQCKEKCDMSVASRVCPDPDLNVNHMMTLNILLMVENKMEPPVMGSVNQNWKQALRLMPKVPPNSQHVKRIAKRKKQCIFCTMQSMEEAYYKNMVWTPTTKTEMLIITKGGLSWKKINTENQIEPESWMYSEDFLANKGVQFSD